MSKELVDKIYGNVAVPMQKNGGACEINTKGLTKSKR